VTVSGGAAYKCVYALHISVLSHFLFFTLNNLKQKNEEETNEIIAVAIV